MDECEHSYGAFGVAYNSCDGGVIYLKSTKTKDEETDLVVNEEDVDWFDFCPWCGKKLGM